jgi:hypothetical protein
VLDKLFDCHFHIFTKLAKQDRRNIPTSVEKKQLFLAHQCGEIAYVNRAGVSPESQPEPK